MNLQADAQFPVSIWFPEIAKATTKTYCDVRCGVTAGYVPSVAHQQWLRVRANLWAFWALKTLTRRYEKTSHRRIITCVAQTLVVLRCATAELMLR